MKTLRKAFTASSRADASKTISLSHGNGNVALDNEILNGLAGTGLNLCFEAGASAQI